MQGLFAYSGIAAKVRAMQGKLVKKEEYEEMAELDSVQEVVDYLKRYPAYEKLLTVEMVNHHQRAKIEEFFRQSFFVDYYKIYLFADAEQRIFLDIYGMRFENAILKRCLRMIFDNQVMDLDMPEFVAFFNKRSSLDLVELCNAGNINEFIDGLRDSQFYPVLKRFQESGKAGLFEYENAIDLFFMKRLITDYKKVLKNRDLEFTNHVYGSEIELLNLQWIYRAKKYYHMTPADIYALIIPVHYKMNKETIKALVEADTIDEVIALFRSCYYARYAKEEMNTSSIEKIYYELIGKIRSIYSRKYPYSIAGIENYLYLKEREVDNLTTLLESVRYGLSAEEIKGYIA